MEEQEKKTRKSNSSKASISKTDTAKKTTKKASAATTEKDSKVKKTTATSKTAKRATTKKEEKKPTAVKENKENIAPKVEKKLRTVATTKKSTDNKISVPKTSKIEKNKKEENGEKEPIAPKSKTSKPKNKVEQKKETETFVDTKISANTKKSESVAETKKETKQPKTNKTQQKEQKQEAKSKKYIEISIGGIIAVICIGLLIILNITLGKKAYNVTKEKNSTQNSTVDTSATTEETIGTVLNSQNQIVSKLLDKITLPLGTTASIYQIGAFDENTIPDDLKLRIGWANLTEELKFHAKQATGESIIVVERAAMEESIKEILGTQVKYKDTSFDNTNVKEFSEYSETQGIITYDGETYTGIVNETMEEGNVAFVYQEIQKVVQYDDKISILVKTAFVKQENNTYVIYQNYNENFENKLMEITPDELFKNTSFNKITGEGATAISKNVALNDIRTKLNTYKYTFTKDNSTGEYYLKEFGKENSNA